MTKAKEKVKGDAKEKPGPVPTVPVNNLVFIEAALAASVWASAKVRGYEGDSGLAASFRMSEAAVRSLTVVPGDDKATNARQQAFAGWANAPTVIAKATTAGVLTKEAGERGKALASEARMARALAKAFRDVMFGEGPGDDTPETRATRADSAVGEAFEEAAKETAQIARAIGSLWPLVPSEGDEGDGGDSQKSALKPGAKAAEVKGDRLAALANAVFNAIHNGDESGDEGDA